MTEKEAELLKLLDKILVLWAAGEKDKFKALDFDCVDQALVHLKDAYNAGIPVTASLVNEIERREALLG